MEKVEKRHIDCCRKLLGNGLPGGGNNDALVRQAARVLARLETMDIYKDGEKVDDDKSALSLFNQAQLIKKPANKKDKRGYSIDFRSSLSFAVSIYPSRSCRGRIKEDLDNYLKTFHDFMEYYRSHPDPVTALEGKIDAYLGDKNFMNLHEDLNTFKKSLAQILLALGGIYDDRSWAHEELVDRRNGAAFFLGAIPPEQLCTVARNFQDQDEKDFIILLQQFPEPPSKILSGKLENGESDDPQKKRLIEQIGRLESISKKQVYDDGVRDKVWDRLHSAMFLSGFPYFSYQAHLYHWWQGRMHPSNAEKGEIAIDIDEPQVDRHLSKKYSQEAASPSFEPQKDYARLISIREGYRLCRWSFFKKSMDADDSRVARRIVDSLWRDQLEDLFIGKKKNFKELKDLYQQIINKDKEFKKISNFNNYYFKLQKRIWAYILGRERRYGSKTLLEKRLNPERKVPLVGKEPMALTIATMGKTALRQNTFLGPFLTFILLKGKAGMKTDVLLKGTAWDQEIIGELWHWMHDCFFYKHLQQSIAQGSQVDKAISEAIKSKGSLAKLAAKLSKITDATVVQPFCERNKFLDEKKEALDLIEKLTGKYGLDVITKEGKCKGCKLRKSSFGKNHLTLPIWYLVVLEKLNRDDVFSRLAIDQLAINSKETEDDIGSKECKDAISLINLFQGCLTCNLQRGKRLQNGGR
jgi:hypothetical protein